VIFFRDYGSIFIVVKHLEKSFLMEEKSMSFTEAIASCFKQYANFNGRARRSEYWFFTLLTCCVSLLSSLLTYTVSETLGSIVSLASLALVVPGIAVAVRRLHDIGKSGWYYLFCLIPLVGAIILLVWYCKDSMPGDNMYGPNPKGVGGSFYGQQPMM
jgi:uncharacterized membrane protein YhaH (DUF805 family)